MVHGSPPLRPMLWLVAMAVFMQMLDTTIVNTALPSMVATALAGMFSKRIVVPLVHRLGYRRVLVGNTLLVGLAMASFALVRAETPWYLLGLQFAGGLLGAFGGTSINPGRGDALWAFRWSFVCVGR